MALGEPSAGEVEHEALPGGLTPSEVLSDQANDGSAHANFGLDRPLIQILRCGLRQREAHVAAEQVNAHLPLRRVKGSPIIDELACGMNAGKTNGSLLT